MSGSLIDRAIAYVSPRAGLRRQRDRARLSMGSGYDAAKRELAALRNLHARGQTGDGDILPDLEVQRARSRKLIMNAPLAGGAVSTTVANVVGHGLRMSTQADGATLSMLAGVTADQVRAFEEGAEREWRMFCRREHCDSAGRLNFASIQDLAFRSVLADGDCFLPVVQAPRGRPFDFALQLIEADRVCNPRFRPDSQTLAGGVEYDAAGAVTAYHVATQDRMTATKTDWRRLDAWAPDGSPRVLHLLHVERIGQSRGVPFLSPVMAALADLDRYTQAEITAAVLNACIAITGESPTGEMAMAGEADAAGNPTSSSPGFRRANIDFEPGLVMEGFLPGEKVQSFDATRPNNGFDPFVQAVLRQVGVRLGLPFEVLVLHFTASYSAARAALLQAWKFFHARRAWLADALCQPTYELVLRNAVARGRLSAPGFMADPMLRAAWCGARWTGPTPGQIDPLKEVLAAEKRLALRISTRTRETAELTGDEWQQVLIESAEEDAAMRAIGIAPAPASPVAASTAPEPANPDPIADDAGDSDQEAA